MLIVESTLLTWSTLFALFFAFEYFYNTQEVVFLVFLYPLISLNQNVICHWGWFELWTQYPGSVVPLAMFGSWAVMKQRKIWSTLSFPGQVMKFYGVKWGEKSGMCIHIHTRVYANSRIPVVAGAGEHVVADGINWGLFGAALASPPQGSLTCRGKVLSLWKIYKI